MEPSTVWGVWFSVGPYVGSCWAYCLLGHQSTPQAGLERERQRREWESTKEARNEMVSKGKQK